MSMPRQLFPVMIALGFAALGCGRSDGPAPPAPGGDPASPAKAATVAGEVVLDVPGMT